MCSTPRPRAVKPRRTSFKPTFNAEQQSSFTQIANKAVERREAIQIRERVRQGSRKLSSQKQHASSKPDKSLLSGWLHQLGYWLFEKKWSW